MRSRLSCCCWGLLEHNAVRVHHIQVRNLQHNVYRLPAEPIHTKSILPVFPSFIAATNGLSNPAVFKGATKPPETRNEWKILHNNDWYPGKPLSKRRKKRHKLLGHDLEVSPYEPPHAMLSWFSPASKGNRCPVTFSPDFVTTVRNLGNRRFPFELYTPPRHIHPKVTKSQSKWYHEDGASNSGEQNNDTETEGQDSQPGSSPPPLGTPIPTPPSKAPVKETFQTKWLPLSALVDSIHSPWYPPFSLYLAQVSLQDLPRTLQDDLEVPHLIAGTSGYLTDIYDSSIWMGTEPTYTSLHRDPNPNYFVQLCGRKYIRLMNPDFGHRIFHSVRTKLQDIPGGSPNMRGPEMMTGVEKIELEREIWGDWLTERTKEYPFKPNLDVSEPVDGNQRRFLMDVDVVWEAVLDPGDALVIPLGWWHSVRSDHYDARINASVNWWFRMRNKLGSDGEDDAGRVRPSGPHEKDRTGDEGVPQAILDADKKTRQALIDAGLAPGQRPRTSWEERRGRRRREGIITVDKRFKKPRKIKALDP